MPAIEAALIAVSAALPAAHEAPNSTWPSAFSVSLPPLAAGESPMGNLTLFLMALVATTIMVIVTRRRARARQAAPSPRAYARQQASRLREKHGMQDDIRELVIELERLAREINGQLDNKFQRLELAIRQADERIARLQGLSPGGLEASHGKPPRQPDVSRPAKAAPRSANLRPATTGRLDITVGDDDPSSEAVGGAPPRRKEELRRAVETTHTQILHMAEKGDTSAAIARATGRPLGEVELIINMHHAKRSTKAS